ncbi:MAG TPA: AmmeMemoRadiSam system protein B [Syntrophobacteraceae bacterium]|nr:AmmeMemoRadiSam system protein B [Syntrophobacteraceae bacterium]
MRRKFTTYCRFLPFFAVFLVFSLYHGWLRAGQESPALNSPASSKEGSSAPSMLKGGSEDLIHGPVVAGTWYPGTATELRRLIEDYLSRVPERESKGKTLALIAPHAGYIYSGQVAAHSFKTLLGQKFDSVIVIGPSHYVPFRGVATYDCAGFRTPLGVIPLDKELIAALMKSEPGIKDLPAAFQQEHSLEAELPFLQVVLPVFKLVPLLMGDHDIVACRRLAEAITACIKDKPVLIVASSDLSHYHSYDVAAEMDQRLLQKIGAMDIEGVDQCLGGGKCEACGQGPIMTVMLAAKKLGVDRCEILKYANSGDVTGEKMSPRGVVGYAAASILTPRKPGAAHDKSDRDRDEKEQKKVGTDLGFSKEEKAQLHEIARKAIEARLTHAAPVSREGGTRRASETVSQKLKEPRGAFVTLYKRGELRGCIGQIVARMPLADAVEAMAQEAAFGDPRFPPLRSDELGDIKIEISVLTPLQKVASTDDIEIGKHGIVIARNGSMGLLLPQVATEYNWDRTEFLEHCCLKAGLSRNMWKDKETEIYTFSADVF